MEPKQIIVLVSMLALLVVLLCTLLPYQYYMQKKVRNRAIEEYTASGEIKEGDVSLKASIGKSMQDTMKSIALASLSAVVFGIGTYSTGSVAVVSLNKDRVLIILRGNVARWKNTYKESFFVKKEEIKSAVYKRKRKNIYGSFISADSKVDFTFTAETEEDAIKACNILESYNKTDSNLNPKEVK